MFSKNIPSVFSIIILSRTYLSEIFSKRFKDAWLRKIFSYVISKKNVVLENVWAVIHIYRKHTYVRDCERFSKYVFSKTRFFENTKRLRNFRKHSIRVFSKWRDCEKTWFAKNGISKEVLIQEFFEIDPYVRFFCNIIIQR